MVVRNNLSAVNTLNTLNRNHTALAKSLQTVSSGMRINSAKDDTSGYAISERMRVQIRSLNQDNQNTQNGHSMMKVAEGAVQSTVDILKTLKEKVINAANDTNTDSDRAQIQKELNQSIDQINDNANVTYNGKYLVDGSKNSKGIATYTSLTNYSLHETTGGGTTLTDLKDRNGENLGILSTDMVTVSYVQNGKTHTGSYTVGDTSLQNIFQEAENLDRSSYTFADRYNTAMAKTMGVDDPGEAATQAAAARAYVGTTAGVATSAAGLNTTYGAYLRAAQEARDAYRNAIANYNSLPGVTTPQTAGLLSTAANNFSDLCANNEGIAGTGCAAPSTLAGNTQISAVITNDSYGDNVLPSYITAYKDAYDALNDFVTQHPLSGVSMPDHPDISLLGEHYSQTYDNSTYNDYALSATAVANEAANIANSLTGPCVLSDSKVGVSKADEVIETSNREKAVTVMADSSGIDGQISGFTVCVTDKNGNIKKSVNAKLDAWEESIRAENKSDDNAVVLHIGTKANQAIKIGLTDMRARALGLQADDGTTLNVSTQEKANAAINVLDNALKKALDQQTTIGSIESRLGYTSTNLTTAIENVTASESTIRDADMALAMTEYTKNNILAQSSQAMLAQANQSNNQVLSLLR